MCLVVGDGGDNNSTIFTEMRHLCSCALGWLYPGSSSGGVSLRILKCDDKHLEMLN